MRLEWRGKLFDLAEIGRRRLEREQGRRDLRHDFVERQQQRTVGQAIRDLLVSQRELVHGELVGDDLPLHRREPFAQMRQQEVSRHEQRDTGPQRVFQAFAASGEHLYGELIDDTNQRHPNHRLRPVDRAPRGSGARLRLRRRGNRAGRRGRSHDGRRLRRRRPLNGRLDECRG